MASRIFSALLIAFHILLLSGARTAAVAPFALLLWIGFFLVSATFYKKRAPHFDYLQSIDSLLRRFYTKPVVVFLICAHMLVGVLGLVFNFLGLDGTLWDLTMYIQQTYNTALTGEPLATFPGEILNHHNTHRSLSLYLLAGLYWITQSPLVVPIYQGLMLYAPGLVFAYSVKHGSAKTPHYAMLFAFYAYAMNAGVMNQGTWPYAFYMLGPSLLALAYYFYVRSYFYPWLFTLVLLPLEKEDYGFLTAGFAFLALYDAFKKRKKSWLQISSSIALIGWGVGVLVWFHKYNATVVSFESRYSELGKSPFAAVITILTNPTLVISILSRPENLSLLGFVTIISFAYLCAKKSLKFLIPIVLVLVANLLSSYAAMKTLKDPYVLPLVVGAISTLVFSVVPDLSKRYGQPLAWVLMAMFSFTSLFWSHQTTYRTLKENYTLYSTRTNERIALNAIKSDKNAVICCEDRLCSYLADRPLIVEARHCISGNKLVQTSHEVVYIVYSNTTLDLKNTQWVYESDLIKISKPTAHSANH